MILTLLVGLAATAQPALLFADQPRDAEAFHVRALVDGRVVELAHVAVRADHSPVGTVSPDGHTLLLASTPPDGERTQRGELLAVNLATGTVQRLATGILALERPRFTQDGKRALFVRLRDFAEPAPEHMKQGELGQVTTELWSVGLDGAGERRLAGVRAFGVNLVGTTPGLVWLYRVDREGVEVDTVADMGGEVQRRFALPHGPFARDFSIAGDALVLSTATDGAHGVHAVESYALSDGQRRSLVQAVSPRLAPLATGRGVLFSQPAVESDGTVDDVLTLLGGREPLLAGPPASTYAEAATPDLGLVAVRRVDAAGAHLVWLDRRGAAPEAAQVPTDEDFTVFGFGEVRR
jgi:hypothetical protein